MDPIATQTTLTLLLSFLPEPYRTYAADAFGLALLAIAVAAFVCRWVKPPSTNSPAWVQALYRFVSGVAQNRGWAANVVVPGMSPAVQQAAKAAAEVAASMPALAVVPVAVPSVPVV